jgi:2-methylcitrate dehydratase
MRQAIGMAVSSHISLNRSRGGQISNWKAATSANDSRNGVFCALAALKGMTGPIDVFEGKGGFCQNTGSQFEMMPLGGQQGTPFRIMGAEIKGFPAGYPSHTGIEAAIELYPKIKAAADIEEIRLFTGPSGMGYAAEEACWHPETRERADHSHPFLLSLALTEGSVEVRHFEEAYYKHPEIVALMQKVKVQVGNEPEHHKAGPGMPTAVVEVDLKSGDTLRMKKSFNATRAEYLRTDKGQEEKLRPMVEALLPKAQTDALFESLRTLEQQRDIRDVLALTIAPKDKGW